MSDNHTALQTNEALDNDLALLAESAQALTSGMVGDPMKFVKGVWKLKSSDGTWLTVGQVQQFIVDVLSYQHGWIRWHEKKPTHRYMGRAVDYFPLPGRSRLPEPELENSEEDPWQETHSIVMRDLGGGTVPNKNGKLYTYTATSWNGRKALGRLLDTFVKHAKEHPGEMPVVYLGTKEKDGAHGPVMVPLFTIESWMPFGEGASPPGKRLTSVPPIPQLTDQSDRDDDPIAADFGGPKPKPKGGNGAASMDDEIPF